MPPGSIATTEVEGVGVATAMFVPLGPARLALLTPLLDDVNIGGVVIWAELATEPWLDSNIDIGSP